MAMQSRPPKRNFQMATRLKSGRCRCSGLIHVLKTKCLGAYCIQSVGDIEEQMCLIYVPSCWHVLFGTSFWRLTEKTSRPRWPWWQTHRNQSSTARMARSGRWVSWRFETRWLSFGTSLATYQENIKVTRKAAFCGDHTMVKYCQGMSTRFWLSLINTINYESNQDMWKHTEASYVYIYNYN